jgi:hypothetical protein
MAVSMAVAADTPNASRATYIIKIRAAHEVRCDVADLLDLPEGAGVSAQVAQFRLRLRDLACGKSN